MGIQSCQDQVKEGTRRWWWKTLGTKEGRVGHINPISTYHAHNHAFFCPAPLPTPLLVQKATPRGSWPPTTLYIPHISGLGYRFDISIRFSANVITYDRSRSVVNRRFLCPCSKRVDQVPRGPLKETRKILRM